MVALIALAKAILDGQDNYFPTKRDYKDNVSSNSHYRYLNNESKIMEINSDFDVLHPAIMQELSPNWCKYFSEYFQVDNACRYDPFHPYHKLMLLPLTAILGNKQIFFS